MIDIEDEEFFFCRLSHKIYRLVIKKLRRKLSRQRLAKERDDKKENDPLYQAWIIHKENLRIQREVEEEKEM